MMVEDNMVRNRKLIKIFSAKRSKRKERIMAYKDYMMQKQYDSEWEDIDKRNLMTNYPLMEQHNFWDTQPIQKF